MEKKLIFATIFILTGCPGPGDRLIPRTETTVVVNDNSVCALSIMKPGEKMTAMDVYSSKGEPVFIRFYDKPLYIPHGQCLPLFGTTFDYGTKYTVAWDIHTADGMYMLTAEFTLSTDSASHFSPINNPIR